MKSTNLRLPDELHASLKTLAAQDHRSLNAQIVALLEDAVRRRHLLRPTPRRQDKHQ